MDFLSLLIENVLMFWLRRHCKFVSNSSCCAVHDECYDTCGEDKDLCDLTFRKCLYRVCRWDSDNNSWMRSAFHSKFRKEEHARFLDNKKCKLKAKLFYMAVVGVGCTPFKDAQKAACDCAKTEL